jgi:hypothetical protein
MGKILLDKTLMDKMLQKFVRNQPGQSFFLRRAVHSDLSPLLAPLSAMQDWLQSPLLRDWKCVPRRKWYRAASPSWMRSPEACLAAA